MSDRQDEKLDAMLRARRVEPASPDLAQRIILKAQSLPQNQTIPLWQWMRQLFAEFHLPRPAYVFDLHVDLRIRRRFQHAAEHDACG